MKHKYLPYLILLILVNINFNLFAQIGQNSDCFQQGKRLFDGEQFLSAKTILKCALVDAKTNYDSNKIIEIEHFISLCDIELNPKNAVKIISIFDRKYPQSTSGIELKTKAIEILIKKGEFKLALEFLALIKNKTLSQNYLLAYLYYQNQDYDSAKKLFQELANLPNYNISKPSTYYLGLIYLDNKNYEEVIKTCEQLDNFPKDIDGTKIKVISQEENTLINKSFTNIWISSLYKIDNKPPYKSVIDLAEKKNILQDKSTNVFSSDIKKFIAQLYFINAKYSESAKIYTSLSINPLTDSIVKYRQLIAELKKPGIEKGELQDVIKGFKELIPVKSDSLRQHVYFNLSEAYIQLNDLKSAQLNLDNSIELNVDTVLSREAQVRKINYYTKSKDYKSSYFEINKYLVKYKAFKQSSEITNEFNYLLTSENNLTNSITHINEFYSNNEHIKLMFEYYAKNLFIEETKKNKKDLIQIKYIYNAANTFKIDKVNQAELDILYVNEIAKDPSGLFPKIKKLSKEIFTLEEYIDSVSIKRPQNYAELTRKLIVMKDSLSRLNLERHNLMENGIQSISKYFAPPFLQDTIFSKKYFLVFAKQISILFQNSDNNDYSNQSRIINTIFSSEYSNDTVRKYSIKLYQNILKSNPNLWNSYWDLSKLQKLSSVEKDFLLYYGVWLKYQQIDINNESLREEFYNLCEEYYAKYTSYNSEVKSLEQKILIDDPSPKTCARKINELSRLIDKLSKDSPEYLNLIKRRIDECIACGRNQKINSYHTILKNDIYEFIKLSKSSELIDQYRSVLIDELLKMNNEIEVVNNFSKFLSIQKFWEIFRLVEKSNSPASAIAILDSFATYFPEKNTKTCYILEKGKIYLKINDIPNAELMFKTYLSDWKYYELDEKNLIYVAYKLPELSVQTGNFIGLEKIYENLPLKYLLEDYQKRGYLSFLIKRSIDSKSVEAERHFTELYCNITDYEILDQAGKDYYLSKLTRLLEIYKSISAEGYLAELKKIGREPEFENFSKEKQKLYLSNLEEVLNKYRSELTNPTIKLKVRSTLNKLIKAKKEQKIDSGIKNNYWELADILIREDSISNDWIMIKNEIGKLRKSTRDSLTYVEKLVEFRDIRCQKEDVLNVKLFNVEIFENCKNVPGFPLPNSMKDIGGSAILDYAKNLWFGNQFLELNSYINDLFQTDRKKSLYPRQISNILQEVYLLFGLSYEKQNNCEEAKIIYSQAYNLDGLNLDLNIRDIIFERYKKLKCAQ